MSSSCATTVRCTKLRAPTSLWFYTRSPRCLLAQQSISLAHTWQPRYRSTRCGSKPHLNHPPAPAILGAPGEIRACTKIRRTGRAGSSNPMFKEAQRAIARSTHVPTADHPIPRGDSQEHAEGVGAAVEDTRRSTSTQISATTSAPASTSGTASSTTRMQATNRRCDAGATMIFSTGSTTEHRLDARPPALVPFRDHSALSSGSGTSRSTRCRRTTATTILYNG